MKKIFIYAVVAALAMIAISCQKKSLNENLNASDDGLVFTASIDGGMDTKTTLSEKKVNWESTDEITVNGVVYTAALNSDDATKADFTKKNSSDADPTGTFNAFYPAGIQTGTTAGGILPAEQTYTAGKITNVPMFATSTTKSLSFKNICAVLAVTVKSADFASVKSIKVSSSNCALSGAFTVSDGQTAALTSEAQTAKAAVTLNCGTDAVTTASEGTLFYIAIPAQTYQNLKIELSSNGKNYTKSMATKKDADIKVAVNTVYPITFQADASVLLPGEFSVSDTKKVKFTKGNLWCNSAVSPVEWHLESSQTAYPTSWSTNHVGHFFWTNLTDYQSATASYMPYASRYSYSAQSKSDKFWCGEDNKLTVDGQGGLYALTGSNGEWHYLINGRDNASGLYKYGVSVTTDAGTVNNCLVIAPDDWNDTSNPLQSSYTAEEWAAAESSGLVCLPAAGYRSGTRMKFLDSEGYYWSASPYGFGNSDACNLNFYDGYFPSSSSCRREYGNSVRLVCTVSE